MNDEVAKLMVVFRKAPYGSIYAFEGLENVLIMGAYDQDVSVMFIDDGVFAIKKDMDTTAMGIKNFSPTFKALEAYDIEKVYIDRSSMEARGLSAEDLVIDAQIIESDQVEKMMEDQKNFMIF